jgi:hypothetical protein
MFDQKGNKAVRGTKGVLFGVTAYVVDVSKKDLPRFSPSALLDVENPMLLEAACLYLHVYILDCSCVSAWRSRLRQLMIGSTAPINQTN